MSEKNVLSPSIVSLLVLFVLIFSGCYHAKKQMYEGKTLPKEKVCVVFPIDAHVELIDGKNMRGSLQGYWLVFLPGDYKMDVRFVGAPTSYGFYRYSVNTMPVYLKCEAGHNYYLKFDFNQSRTNWGPYIEDIGSSNFKHYWE